MKRVHRGEKGFTLIELLIVIAILGIIAAIVIPNAAGFMTTGKLNAANTEVANVKTAAIGYMAEHGEWPFDTTVAGFSDYLSGTLKATYRFYLATPGKQGMIYTATAIGTDYAGLSWCELGQKWIRTGGSCP